MRGRVLLTVVDWLRGGYADDAPCTGYSPLIALHGPIGLSESQSRHIVAGLQPNADRTDVEVAITKVTDDLPTRAQVGKINDLVQRSQPGGRP